MADQRITDLTAGATVHSDDWLVYVDTHDTTMDASGTDKKLAPSVLSAAVTITESQVTGLTADLAAKATDSLVVHLAGLETISGAKTFSSTITGNISGNAGTVTNGVYTTGAGTVYLAPSGSGAALTGITASQIGSVPAGLLKGSGGAFAAAASADLPTIALTGNVTGSASGGSIATTIPAGTITYSMHANEGVSSLLGNPTGSPAAPSEVTLGANLGFVGSALRCRVPICWVLIPGTAVANTTALTSLFAGATLGGSLTLPANVLQPGSMIRFELFGTYGATASSPNVLVQVSLGGTVVTQGTASALANVTGNLWDFSHVNGPGLFVQSVSSSGKIIGCDRMDFAGSSAGILNASGVQAAAPSQVTINTTVSQAIDIKVQWSAAAVANTMQLLGGAIYLDY